MRIRIVVLPSSENSSFLPRDTVHERGVCYGNAVRLSVILSIHQTRRTVEVNGYRPYRQTYYHLAEMELLSC